MSTNDNGFEIDMDLSNIMKLVQEFYPTKNIIMNIGGKDDNSTTLYMTFDFDIKATINIGLMNVTITNIEVI